MKAAIVVMAIVIAGVLLIERAVLPGMHNAKVEGLVIGEEAGKVMSRVGAFYSENGRFPASVNELRLKGAAVREYRLHESDASKKIELVYFVRGGEVTIQHESGTATFVPVLEERQVARWQLKGSSYSATARAPVEQGAMLAIRCLGEAKGQPDAGCARFRASRD